MPTLLTELGIGEALVTALNEKGRPTPLVHTLLRAPESRMDVLTEEEIREIVSRSGLVRKYNKTVDRESAYEILQEKIEEARRAEHQQALREQQEKARRAVPRSRRSRSRDKSMLEKVLSSTTTRQIGRTIARELTRGLLGVLGISTSRRRRRRR